MLKRLPLVLSLLLFTHCAAGAIREHSLDSSEIQNSTSEKVLVWQEGPSGDSRVRRVDSGIFTSSFRELSEYSSWLNQSPVDCDGFASRQYWARRSYPIFFRWKDTRGPRLDATDDSRSLQEAKEAYGPENETGAPANTSLADQSFRRIFLSFRNAGMLISDDGGKSFRRSDLPRRFVGEKEASCDPELYRDVVGVWQHPRDSRIILAVNIQDLLLSMDGGRTFRAIEFRGLSHLKSRNIFASVAASLEGGKINRIYLGTAYNGIKVLTISQSELLAYQRNERPFSAHVRDMNRGLPGLLHEPGVVFYEHILDLRWIPETGSLIAATLFDPGLAIVSTRREGAEFRFVRLPGAETDTVSESLDCNSEGCTLSSSNSAFFFPLESADHFGHPISLDSSSEGAGARDSGAREFPSNASSSSEKGDQVNKEKNVVSRDFVATVRGPYLNHTGPSLSHRPAPSTEVKRPEVLNAFYISPTSARLKQALVFHLIEKYGFNAAVIDVKDDFGRLTYGSNLPIAREMNNTREIAPVRQLVKELKERGIYTIARQVVFKDLRMHRYKGHRNAIKNRYSGGPWTVEGDEQWTDPFSAEVQTYNLD
ncbi:MAG: hypothetical protein KDK25_15655, partial [Leptospiraceae bacterium]|nr:hypothetical protein [Leptospiraceae bacterium]